MSTVNDTLVAINRGGPAFRQGIETILINKVGDSPPFLEDPTDLRMDQTGNVYVFDRKIPAIHVYSTDGRYERTVGQGGEGPGELKRLAPYRLQVWVDGTIDLVCRYPRHWFRWSSEGELLLDRKVGSFNSAFGLIALPFSDGGGAIGFPLNNTFRDTSEVWPINRYNGHLELVDSILTFPYARKVYYAVEYKGQRSYQTRPFTNEVVYAQDGRGRFAFSKGDSAVVFILDETSNKSIVLRWSDVPAPVSPREAEESLHEAPWFKAIPERYKSDYAAAFRSQVFPSFKPVIARLVFGTDSRLWVEKWGEGGFASNLDTNVPEPDGEYTYSVFSRSGEWEFDTSLPFRVSAASDSVLLTLTHTSEGAPMFSVYRWTMRPDSN